MNYLWSSLIYVASDHYFWFCMGITTSLGMFIGAAVYNGDLKELKKVFLTLGGLLILLAMTNTLRILPLLSNPKTSMQPFAGLATMIYVSLFYFGGMLMGTWITRYAHGKVNGRG